MTNQLTDNIYCIETKGKRIYLIGTAHISEDSKKEAEELIEKIRPDAVVVELCQSRYAMLSEKSRWKNLDILKVIKEGKGFLLLVNMILSSLQKKLGIGVGSAPGEEMIASINKAKELNIPFVLGDRDITTTLKRAWGKSSFMEKVNILSMLVESLFTKEKVSKDQIDNLLKSGDLITEMMNEFAAKLPKVKTTLIDERDTFLANSIENSKGNTIIAVVGKGHQKGIIKKLEEGNDYNPEINTMLHPGKLSKYMGWIITILFFGLFVAGFIIKGPGTGFQMLKLWALITGTACFISSVLVLSHPITMLSSFIVAPITTLNPAPGIGAGVFLAIIETAIKKPKVSDFENLSNDITTFKGFFNNRITKILLVFVATSIGASIGTFIALPWVTSLLK